MPLPLQIMQPMQCASMVVQAYPFMFDMLAVVSVVAEEAGEQPDRQLMVAEETHASLVKEEPSAQPASSVAQERPVLVQAP